MKKKKQTPTPPPIMCWDVYALLLRKVIREKRKRRSPQPSAQPSNKPTI